jgi:hypothetical protein
VSCRTGWVCDTRAHGRRISEQHKDEKSLNFPIARQGQASHSKWMVPVESTVVVYFRKVVVEWSILITVDWVDRKQDHFRFKIDQNLTFHLLLREVTADWGAILYGSSTPARACPSMRSVACTWLDSWREWPEYFHIQSIIFHFCSNCADSQSICAAGALSPLHLTHIMSWPSHYICALWKFSYQPCSFSPPPNHLPSHLSPRRAAQSGCYCYAVCVWTHALRCVKDRLRYCLLDLCGLRNNYFCQCL